MDEGLKRQAQEWFDRGDHDIETAQLPFEKNGHTEIIAFHIQQAIKKYLKGYLVLNGQRPPRVHELDTLLNLAEKFDPNLCAPFIDLCEKATRYYIEDRYPPGPPVQYEIKEIRNDLDLTWSLDKGDTAQS
jgi:HEPN domain-containing protein